MSAPTDRTIFLRRSLQVIFAAALLYNAARATVSRVEAVAAVGAAVLLFALLEIVGLTRLRETTG
jgi:hypothetical protein